jgi:YesN/AraC family two-component response regulator
MVCTRCKMVVKDELGKLGLNNATVELGEVEINQDITNKQRDVLRIALLHWGLELMDNKKSILIEKIKTVIIEMVYADEQTKNNFSVYLSEKLDYDYTYLANIFSEVVTTTIEHYIILHKIERVKELLIYNELSLTEIAFKMHYSSTSHLANQFKKVTGLTTSHFKLLKQKRRSPFEQL